MFTHSLRNIVRPAIAFVALGALSIPASAQRVEATTAGSGTGTRWTFTTGPASLKAGAKNAGRINALQYMGGDILHMDTATATNYGSTFWPSPQAGWTSNWPPAANIDGSGAYTASYADSTLVLNGQTDNNNRVRINKAYWANVADTSFEMRFTIINTHTIARAWAPWQVTRLPAGGMYVFPKGTGPVTGQLAGLTRDSLGHIWFRYDSSTVPTSGTNKFYADGSQGWLAHLNKNRVLFIKKFTDTPAAKKAPGVENEIEIYTTNDRRFVEMEPQGSYDTIPPGDSIVWNVKWYVRKMPDTTAMVVGNLSIVDFVNQVLAGGASSIHDRARAASPPARMTLRADRVAVTLDNSSFVSLSLIDARGAVAQELHSGALERGTHAFRVAPEANGLYWLVLRDANSRVLERRMLPRL